jgi:CheY-like chemotaxis protein
MNPLKNILLIDDDPVEYMKVSRAFKKLEIPNQLLHKSDGLEAKKWLEECAELPGLILLDLNMPNMNGFEFLTFVKSDERLKIIPIVVLTTSNNEKDKVESYKQSVAGYMVKPIRLEEYEKVIATIKDYWTTSKIGHE